jgi:hypothetical protein
MSTLFVRRANLEERAETIDHSPLNCRGNVTRSNPKPIENLNAYSRFLIWEIHFKGSFAWQSTVMLKLMAEETSGRGRYSPLENLRLTKTLDCKRIGCTTEIARGVRYFVHHFFKETFCINLSLHF